MLDDDIPAGANGFNPDPEAWGRCGALVRSTIDTLAQAEKTAPATAVPQPASSASATSETARGVGYGARGWGDLCDQVAALKNGSTSAEAEVEASISTAEARDGALFGIVALEAERAMSAARAIDGKPVQDRGALAGAPYARKDLFFRKGFGAECGAPLFAGQVADQTATMLERLDGADGVDIGRLAMAELAMSPTGFNAHTEHPRNPWSTEHVTGGSSSGSAVAVAGGYVRMALGTDTGGSIRHPAAMSGITGLKPTSNRISRAGVWPLSWSLDCVGPLARSARDCALILDIVSGPDPRDTTVAAPRFKMPDLSGDLSGVRIAVPSGYYFETVTPAVSSALGAAMDELKKSGATIVQTESPDMALVNAMAHILLAVEASSQLGEAFREPNCNVGRQVRDRLEPGLFYSAAAYATALRLRPAIRNAWLSAAMADCDSVLIPAIPREVPTIAETTEGDPVESGKVIGAITHATRGINYLGLPSLALPCGRDASGLPIAFQLVGRADDEATLIRVGDAYQQATDWHLRTPWKG